jgi:hypothetical protein
MHLKSNIRNAFSRKACCIIFILFVSVSFSLGDALANSCKGGPDCLNCAERAHSQVPGAETGMENHSCRSVEQNSTCGFEASRSPYDFHGIASAIRSAHHEYSGLFTADLDEYGQLHFSKKFLSKLHLPDRGEITPIYLLNHCLLC